MPPGFDMAHHRIVSDANRSEVGKGHGINLAGPPDWYHVGYHCMFNPFKWKTRSRELARYREMERFCHEQAERCTDYAGRRGWLAVGRGFREAGDLLAGDGGKDVLIMPD